MHRSSLLPKALPFILLLALVVAPPVFASQTDGTINATNHEAWSDTFGWVDFAATGGDVHVTDSALTGYAWNEKTGWISLNCTNGSNTCTTINFGVANDGNGHLSGKAWSQTVGYIDFAPTGGGVTIDSSGNFSGYAWGDKVGWISFNCSNGGGSCSLSYKVSTDWIPLSARPSTSSSSTPSAPSTGGSRGTTGGTNRNGTDIGGTPVVKGQQQNLAPTSAPGALQPTGAPSSLSPAQQRALLRRQQRLAQSGASSVPTLPFHSASQPFPGVSAGSWYAQAASEAVSKGWMTLGADGGFDPAGTVSTADAKAAFTALGIDLSSIDDALPSDGSVVTKGQFLQALANAYADRLQQILKSKSQVDTAVWNAIPASVSHANSVRMAILAGWINMPQGSFHGAASLTRAEMAKILVNVVGG